MIVALAVNAEVYFRVKAGAWVLEMFDHHSVNLYGIGSKSELLGKAIED